MEDRRVEVMTMNRKEDGPMIDFDLENFHTHDEINGFLNDLASEWLSKMFGDAILLS